MSGNVCRVASKRNPCKPHFIDCTVKNGKVTCDCVNYKTFTVCAHALAGAKYFGVLEQYCRWQNKQCSAPRLDAIVEHNLGSSVGQKKTKKTQKRMGTSTPNQPVSSILTPTGVLSTSAIVGATNVRKTAVQPAAYTVELRFLHNCHHLVKSCYGCNKDIRHPTADPFTPLDLIAVSCMQRTYYDAKEKKEKDGGISNVYFHLRLECIMKKISDFEPKELIVAKAKPLALPHKRHVRAAMKHDYVFD